MSAVVDFEEQASVFRLSRGVKNTNYFTRVGATERVADGGEPESDTEKSVPPETTHVLFPCDEAKAVQHGLPS